MTMANPELMARFEALLSSHRDRAIRLAWRIVGGDEAAAEDVAQDAFVAAFRGLARFRGGSSLETWFYRILVRKAYNHVRWRKVRDRFGRADPEETGDPRPTPQGDPALRRRLAQALESLPRNQRDSFLLVHLEGFTVRETADILGKAPGTIKSHLHRALEKLRHQLSDAFQDSMDADTETTCDAD